MTTTKKNNKFLDLIESVNGVVYLILFIISIGGWIVSGAVNRANIKNSLDENTKVLQELKTDIDKINDFNLRQAELNGKFIEYMKSTNTK